MAFYKSKDECIKTGNNLLQLFDVKSSKTLDQAKVKISANFLQKLTRKQQMDAIICYEIF